MIEFNIPDMPKEERPPCPVCGAHNPTSHGGEWKCSNPECLRRFGKHPHPRETQYFYDRAPCPVCGAYRGAKRAGNRLLCGACGREYPNYKPEVIQAILARLAVGKP